MTNGKQVKILIQRDSCLAFCTGHSIAGQNRSSKILCQYDQKYQPLFSVAYPVTIYKSCGARHL